MSYNESKEKEEAKRENQKSPERREKKMHIPIINDINAAVFALMDRIYLRRRLKIKKPKVARLELVAFDSRWATAYPAMGRRGLIFALIGAGTGGFAALAIAFLQAFQNFERFLREGLLQPNWWLVLGGVVVMVAPILILTWFLEEWNRNNRKYVVFTHASFIVQVEAPFGLPYISWGPTTLIEEQIVSSAMERTGTKNPSLLGQAYDGLLWLWKGSANVFLPSRVFGAADRWRAPEEAWGRSRALQNIADIAQGDKLLREVVLRKLADARLEDAKEAGSWFGAAGKAQEVLDAYNRLIGATGVETEWFDLTDPSLKDPGLWGPDGEPIEAEPAARVGEAPPAISFPEA